MDSLPPIPTPLGQHWREIRIQILPVVFFIFLVTAVVFLWMNYVQPVSVVGEVEAVKANASSLQEGILTKLTVDRFDHVTAGQVIGEVLRTDPALVQASLAAIQADLKVMRARMLIEDQRREVNYQGLWVNLMDEKVELENDKALLASAANEFKRVSELLETKVASPSQFDTAKAAMESLQAKIKERQTLIKDLTETVASLKLSNKETMETPIEEAIKAKEHELELNLKPLPLTAPINGVVSMVFRRTGEKVMRGEPILTVSAPDSDRIVGFIRQPVGRIPAVNDKIEVRTRGQRRVKGQGQILEVGAQMEPINPVLLSADANRLELGLPILVSVPSGFEIRPGEVVDLFLLSSPK
jgi:multidrug resistance efflux pump